MAIAAGGRPLPWSPCATAWHRRPMPTGRPRRPRRRPWRSSNRVLHAPQWPTREHRTASRARPSRRRNARCARSRDGRARRRRPVALDDHGRRPWPRPVGHRRQRRRQPGLLAEPSGDGGRLLTVDDSWAQERSPKGCPPRWPAHPEAHTITRWIGADADSVDPDRDDLRGRRAGLLVALHATGCGTTSRTPSGSRSWSPPRVDRSPSGWPGSLTDAALDAGGQDNITVAVRPVGPAHARSRSRNDQEE